MRKRKMYLSVEDIAELLVEITHYKYLKIDKKTRRSAPSSSFRCQRPDFIWNQKRTEENGKKKCTVLFSYLLEKKDRTYNSVNDPEIFALEIELFAPVVRV